MDTYADTYPRPMSRDARDGRDDYRPSDAPRERRRSPDRRRDRRPRSRSPALGGRRSRSPQIDRYQPGYQPDRPPRNDHYRRDDYRERERRRSPQPASIDRYVPGMDAPAPPPAVNPLPDPMSLEYQVGFTWFAEWWRSDQRIKEEKERQKTGRPPPRLRERESREDREGERTKIQAAYDEYKANLQKAQAQAFVRMHKSEDWFRERYVPEARDPFRQRLMEYRKGLFEQWEQDLTGGLFDEFTLEGIYKAEANGQGGVVEKEEGETTAAAEVLGVGDLLPSKGGDIRDPAAMHPTLLVKTIAPTVSRAKFEDFAKEHLGEGDGGFKHLSLSDPNPQKKCHRMGWVLLKPEAEQEPEEEMKLDTEEGEESCAVKEKPLSTSGKALEKINAKTIEDGERGFTVYCGVHRPPESPRKKALWDLFSAPERINRDLALVTRLVRKLDNEMGDEYFGVAKIEERVHELAENGLLNPTEAPKADNDDIAMDQEEAADEGMIEEDDSDGQDLLMKKKKLDLLVEYLRRVYNFCFFCVFESDSVHEMQRKCPGGHLRRPRGSLTSAAKEVARASADGEPFPLKKNGESKLAGGAADANNATGDVADEDGELEPESPTEERKAPIHRPNQRNASQLQRAYNWVRTFEEKILQILEPEKVNLRKLGGIPIEEGLEEELSKFVKQEDHSKYRCKVPDCTKLFKSPDFWRKHVEKRHPEWHAKMHADLALVNTYVLDPSHIAPSRSDANSNGHFPVGQGVAAGTPRGFSLGPQGHHPGFPMGFPLGAGVPGNAGVPPGMMYGLPAGFPQMPGGMPGMPGGGVGPIRSHGGRSGGRMGAYGGAMVHPYMRPDGRGGRPMMPPMGMGVRGAPGGDIGPNEAVAGRSLRSYEDLDEVQEGDGGAGAVLDY